MDLNDMDTFDEELKQELAKAVEDFIGFPKELGEDFSTTMRRSSFAAGARWMHKHLREVDGTENGTIWHGADELPVDGCLILMKTDIYKADELNWRVTNYDKDDKAYFKTYVVKWCYIDDIN